MSHHPRRILTAQASRKRKEREPFYSFKPSPTAQAAPYTASKSNASSGEPLSCNRLLAGYLAHEFLTKGTFLGQKFDPARAEAVPLVGSANETSKRTKPEAEPNVKKENKSYAEVASILKVDGAHIPGVVNPTQLARWIQM